jgi:pimeloyl-ACP methyl ester carboxylesterase
MPPQPKPRARILLFTAGVLGLLVLAAWRPVDAHLRAASLLERFGDVTHGSADVTEEAFPIAGARFTIRGRLYTPHGTPRGAILLVPGVHHLGIDEARLVRFARAIGSAGVVVLTVETGALKDYRIEGASADDIGEAAHALRAHVGHPVGVMGMSFAGGLALLAASDPRFAPDVAFVVAVGAHDDLARVLRFFATNAIPRPDGSVARLTAHPYGPLVLVYDRVADFFPPADVPGARDALRLWLWEEKDLARARLATLTPDARAKLTVLFDGGIASIAPELLAEIDAHPDAMRAASPHGRLGGLHAPVFLLHGAGDSVIPATETLWLAADIPKGLVRDELVSPALVHVELEGEPSKREKWALVHFMAEVLEAAGS